MKTYLLWTEEVVEGDVKSLSIERVIYFISEYQKRNFIMEEFLFYAHLRFKILSL
jgi:hypothetical protein